MQPLKLTTAKSQKASDEELVAHIVGGELALFELLMRRHNQRLFRVLRPMVATHAEAEDLMQETYVRAFTHLASFQHRSRFTTWLFRIGINEARRRSMKARRFVALPESTDESGDFHQAEASLSRKAIQREPAPLWSDPDRTAQRREASRMLESAVCALPPESREVIVLRDVDGLSTAEAAQCLGLTAENVRVRLHRARRLLRKRIAARLGEEALNLFAFGGRHCDLMVQAVLERTQPEDSEGSATDPVGSEG